MSNKGITVTTPHLFLRKKLLRRVASASVNSLVGAGVGGGRASACPFNFITRAPTGIWVNFVPTGAAYNRRPPPPEILKTKQARDKR